MFLAKFDWLTPPITLYYKGELQHSSICSAIISILGYLSSIIIGLYLSIDFFKRKSPTVFSFNRFIDDAGIFPLNSKSMFSFIQFRDVNGVPSNIDPSYIRLVGTISSIESYASRNDVTRKDHWLYDLCNNDTDIDGVEHLYNYRFFNNSYCIRKYYNKIEDKYYTTGDKNFKYPSVDHGVSHVNKTYYGIVFEQCKYDRAYEEINHGIPCQSEEDIKNYVGSHNVRFLIIDHYPDVYNYKNPFTKYLYNIDSALSSGSCTVNHLNFNPATIITHNGYFFDNTVENIAYVFDQNEKANREVENGIYLGFWFWLQNRLVYYERTYKKIQDVLAEIQGMGVFIIFIATILNNYVSEYITLSDTIQVLFTLKSANVDRAQIKRMIGTKKRTMFLKNSPPKRVHPFNYSFYNKGKKQENIDMNNLTRKKLQAKTQLPKKNEQVSYLRLSQSKNNMDNVAELSPPPSRNSIEQIDENVSSTIKDKNPDIEIYTNKEKRDIKEKQNVEQFNELQDEELLNPLNTTHISLLEFTINYLFFCKKKVNTIESYENFRMKIISEENLIQNYLDIHSINKTIKAMGMKENG